MGFSLHNVVFDTLNNDFDPRKGSTMHPVPIVIGKNVWIGANATVLPGLTLDMVLSLLPVQL